MPAPRTAVRYGNHPPVPPGTPCEACGAESAKPVTDHCHRHGWVRAVLCRSCNGLMGWWDRHAEITPALLDIAGRCPECLPPPPDSAAEPVLTPTLRRPLPRTLVLGVLMAAPWALVECPPMWAWPATIDPLVLAMFALAQTMRWCDAVRKESQ